jgi:hypothetical protein
MRRKSDILLPLGGILCAATALAALAFLFQLRFSAGDVYPPYSSLRSDPLGTRVLYEALGNCNDITTSRAFEPAYQLELDRDTTLITLGMTLQGGTALDPNEIGSLQGFMRRGGRLAVMIAPTQRVRDNVLLDNEDDEDREEDEEEDEEGPHANGEDEEGDEDAVDTADDATCTRGCDDSSRTRLTAREWLQLDFAYCELFPTATATRGPYGEKLELPPTLACHTTLVLTNLTADWQTVYERDGHPLIAERTIGSGSLVVSTMAFFTSNEAMRSERTPALLTWLAGSAKHVIFDEHHHGIMRHEGIISLAWEYRMHWFAVTLLLLAGLFIWRNAYSLVPRHTMTDAPDSVQATGRDAASGLVNLLRRSIPHSKLERVCFEQWSKTHGRGLDPTQTDRVQAILTEQEERPARKRNLPATHAEIRKILKERK